MQTQQNLTTRAALFSVFLEQFPSAYRDLFACNGIYSGNHSRLCRSEPQTQLHFYNCRNGELFQPRGMPQLRVEEVKMLRQAMEPFMSTLRNLKEVDYPEQMFRVLHVHDFECKQRTICEIEQYLAGKGVAGFILNFLR